MTTRTSTFCDQCGTPVSGEGRFCQECGAPISSAPIPRNGLTNYTQLKELFEKASKIDPDARDGWLREACAGDKKLLADLQGMLSSQTADLLRSSSDSAAREPGAPPIAMLGPYRLLREIGRGGMGVVYLAVRDDGAFRKNVALKLLRSEQVNPEFISRFKQERQVLAALDHPNIARILDGGNTPDGLPYYVMEFIEGLPVDKFCDQQRLSLIERVKLFQQVCKAVDYLHSNSIMHRDLKPSNILVSADGVVKLLDFGIAKVVGAGSWSNPDLTNVEARPMTPTYASPEQIAGVTLQKTSDLYSLGAILYGLLTGRPAYQDLEEKLAKLESRALPPKPSTNIRDDLRSNETTAQFRRAMMGELDSIVLMAMHIDPKQRYQSASSMIEDLQHFLDGSPVTAYHGGVGKRSVKLLRKRIGALIIAAALVALAGAALWQWRQVNVGRQEASARDTRLRALLDRLEGRLNSHLAGAQGEGAIEDVRQLKTAFASQFNKTVEPGPSGERTRLLARGVQYLDHLRAAAPANSSLNVEVGGAYQQLGHLQERLTVAVGTKREALLTYRKAADTLLNVPGTSSVVLDQLRALNGRITALGGTAVEAPPAVVPPPARTEVVATKAPSHRSSAPAIAAPPAPSDETPSAPPVSAEVRESLVTAESKVQVTEQTIAPLQQRLESEGQTLNADTLTRLTNMRSSLERGKRKVAEGDEAGAKQDIAITNGLAEKLLRSVGR